MTIDALISPKNGEAEEYCANKKCVHKGYVGGVVCCDYMLHLHKKRPTEIRDCEGYPERRVVRIDVETHERTFYDDVAKAAEANNVSEETIKNNMHKSESDLNGYIYRRETYSQQLAIERDEAFIYYNR